MRLLANPVYMANLLVNGIFFAGVYGFIAVGLSLIFGILEIVNFAHGTFFMLGGLFMFILLEPFALPYYASLIIGAIAVLLVGLLVEKVAIERVRERNWKIPLVTTLAIQIIIVNATLLTWGGVPQTARTSLLYKLIYFGPIAINCQRLLLVGVAAATFVCLFLFLKRTKTGKAFRALSQDRQAALIVGIRPKRLYLLAFAISAFLAGLAGGLATPIYVVSPVIGLTMLLKGVACVVIGGFGNIMGALLGALIIGILEGIIGGFAPQYMVNLTSFLAIVVVLLFFPRGIFGRHVGI